MPKPDQFLADRFVVGTCPKCDNREAYGDQCEKCGSTLNATDLINPKSTITGETPILKSTKHWFLPLDRYQDFLTRMDFGWSCQRLENQCFRTSKIVVGRWFKTSCCNP